MLLWWVLIKCQCCGMRWIGTGRGCGSSSSRRRCRGCSCLLSSGLSMHFGMTLFFIWPGKFAGTDFARKWLLSSVCPRKLGNFDEGALSICTWRLPDVSCEVVRSTKCPHANPALEWLLSRGDSYVSCKLVWSRKPPIAVGHRAGVWPLMNWGLAGTVRILARAHRH